jgi:uncharacterized protein
MTRRSLPTRPWIDTTEFTRSGGELAAEQSPLDFPRLRDLLADDEGTLAWRLAGERRTRPEGGTDAFLTLRLSGTVHLTCVRCLEPVAATLEAERLFKIAATETLAEREDADSEAYDVLSASPRMEVLELVEDELIMALPIAPRHEDCRLPAAAARGDSMSAPGEEADGQRPNPFAVLAGLRPVRRGNGDGGGGRDA